MLLCFRKPFVYNSHWRNAPPIHIRVLSFPLYSRYAYAQLLCQHLLGNTDIRLHPHFYLLPSFGYLSVFLGVCLPILGGGIFRF